MAIYVKLLSEFLFSIIESFQFRWKPDWGCQNHLPRPSAPSTFKISAPKPPLHFEVSRAKALSLGMIRHIQFSGVKYELLQRCPSLEIVYSLRNTEGMVGESGVTTRPRDHEGGNFVPYSYNLFHTMSIFFTYRLIVGVQPLFYKSKEIASNHSHNHQCIQQ